MNPYIEIIRPSISGMAAFGVLVGALVAGAQQVSLISYAIITGFVVSGAGVVLNDYYDYKIDKINAPHRPLPSGRMSKKTALIYSGILFAIGIVFAALINIYCILLVLLNTFLEFSYAKKLKQIAVIGNITDSWFVASTFIFGALITLDLRIVWILSLLAFLSNMGREITKCIEDIKGDKKFGLKTLPIITSVKFSKRIAQALVILAIILSFLPYYLGFFDIKYLVIVLIADALFLVSLFQDVKINQKTMKIAMVVALVAFLVGSI